MSTWACSQGRGFQPLFGIYTRLRRLVLSLVVHTNNGRVKCDELRELEFHSPADLSLSWRWTPSRPSRLLLVSQTRKPRTEAWVGRGTQSSLAQAPRAHPRPRLLFPRSCGGPAPVRSQTSGLRSHIRASFALIIIFMQELAVRGGHF